MSNPCLNRWGSNIYWNTVWYSDIRYSFNLKQDIIIEDLLQTYLYYGLKVQKSLFWNSYWYKTIQATPKIPTQLSWRYYDKITHFDIITEEMVYYYLRIKQKDLFFMKLWIMKFTNWIVINWYWFQPKNRKMKTKRRTENLVFFHAPKIKTLHYMRRLKTLAVKNYFVLWDRRNIYKF